MGRKMSRREAHRLALHYAINERDSFADAWGWNAPERIEAQRLADEFRRVLKDEFGEVTWEDDFAASNPESVSIFDLMDPKP